MENTIRELSAIFKNYKEIYNSSVGISGLDMEVYKQTSEDVTMKQPVTYANLFAQGYVTTEDGVRIGDALYFGCSPAGYAFFEDFEKESNSFC